MTKARLVSWFARFEIYPHRLKRPQVNLSITAYQRTVLAYPVDKVLETAVRYSIGASSANLFLSIYSVTKADHA